MAQGQADGGSRSTKARVLLIYTGGTIGMAPRDSTNPASPLDTLPLEELRKHMTLG
jgi:L-asparaginase/Glu-tRNA(Gln) amidotransferase subunit D